MADRIRLTPEDSDDETRLPLGFEALDDILRGDTYTDENGNLVSQAELTKRLKEQRGVKRVARIKLRYRLPSDPVEDELRATFVNIPVFGRVDAAELARITHTATRNVYDALRAGKKKND